MRNVWFVGLVIALGAVPGAAQSFEGTHLDPFTFTYHSPPFFYEGSRFLSVTFTTSADVVQALVPEPLDDMMGTVISVMVAEHHIVSPIVLDYREAFLQVPVTFQGVGGYYFPILYLDDAYAIVAGREIWGWTKVDADIDVSWSPGGDTVTATVSRDDATLITIEADFGPTESIPPMEAVVQDYNLKLIPSVEAGGDPEVCQLTRLPFIHDTSGYRTGTGTVEFESIPSDPLADIPIYGYVSVETYYLDIEVPFGQTVWDYLAQPGGCAEVLSSPFLRYNSFESRNTSD